MRHRVKSSAKNPLEIVLKLFAQELVSHSAQFEKDSIRAKRDPQRCLATLGLLEKITDQHLALTPGAAPVAEKSESPKVNSAAAVRAGLSELAAKVAGLPKKTMFYEGINQQFQRAPQRAISQVDILKKNQLGPLGGKTRK